MVAPVVIRIGEPSPTIVRINVGPAGPDGAQGEQGIQGETGLTGADGAAGITWQGAWSIATAYVIRDAVSYLGSAYIAISDHTGETPVTLTSWQLLASKGDTGATGATGPTGPTGATGSAGAAGANGEASFTLYMQQTFGGF